MSDTDRMSIPKAKRTYPMAFPEMDTMSNFFRPYLSENSPMIGEERNIPREKRDRIAPIYRYP
jgi:hypothetical protein